MRPKPTCDSFTVGQLPKETQIHLSRCPIGRADNLSACKDGELSAGPQHQESYTMFVSLRGISQSPIFLAGIGREGGWSHEEEGTFENKSFCTNVEEVILSVV